MASSDKAPYLEMTPANSSSVPLFSQKVAGYDAQCVMRTFGQFPMRLTISEGREINQQQEGKPRVGRMYFTPGDENGLLRCSSLCEIDCGKQQIGSLVGSNVPGSHMQPVRYTLEKRGP